MKTAIWVVLSVVLVITLTLALYAYNNLSSKYTPENMVYDSDNAQIEESYSKAPDFTAVDINGNKIKLSDMKGKPVVVNFWASWCPPCKQEMPDFEEAFRKYGNEITFMMVNMTDNGRETEENAKAFIEESGYTFPVYFDFEMSAAYAYRVNSIPATYFVDADGNLITYAQGMISAELIEKGINILKNTQEK